MATKSGIMDSVLSWVNFKQSKDLKKTDGAKTEKISGIEKLEDANCAGGKNSEKTEENMILAMQERLKKNFKLTTSISTSNMHLFDANGVIKKYDTPEQSMLL